MGLGVWWWVKDVSIFSEVQQGPLPKYYLDENKHKLVIAPSNYPNLEPCHTIESLDRSRNMIGWNIALNATPYKIIVESVEKNVVSSKYLFKFHQS